MFRSPQRTLLPGLGAACAVLAGALVAISLAASLVGVHLPMTDPPSGPAAAVQLEARSEAVARSRERARALGIVAARRTAAAQRQAAAGAPPKAGAAPRNGSAALAVERETQPEHVTIAPPPARAAGPASATPGAASATAGPAGRSPLEPIGSGVNDTTDGAANTLRSLTGELGDGVTPLSPELGGVVTQSGDALGDVVEGTGNVLGQLVGRPAGPR